MKESVNLAKIVIDNLAMALIALVTGIMIGALIQPLFH